MSNTTVKKTAALVILAALGVGAASSDVNADGWGFVKGMGKWGAETVNNVIGNVPVIGDAYKATGAHGAIDKALGGTGYWDMPAGAIKFKVDARTTTIVKTLKGDAFMSGAPRLNVLEDKTISADSLTYGVTPDGFVAIEMNRIAGPRFFYDPVTHMVQIPAGTYRLIKKEFRTVLDSIAQHPAEWKKYAETKRCSDENVVKQFLTGVPGDEPASVFGEDTGVCDDVSAQINVVTATLWEAASQSQAFLAAGGEDLVKSYDREFFQPIMDLNTESGKAMAKAVAEYDQAHNINIGSTLRNSDDAIALLKRYRDPQLQGTIAKVLKDLPPENEIIAQVETNQSASVATGRQLAKPSISITYPNGMSGTISSPGGMAEMRTIQWKELVPTWKPGEDLRGFEFADWAGWMMFTDDKLVTSLKHFDYGDSAVKPVDVLAIREPAYSRKGQSLTWLENNAGRLPVNLSDQARGNWHTFVQSLSADELRKLVIAAGSGNYRTDAIPSGERKITWSDARNDIDRPKLDPRSAEWAEWFAAKQWLGGNFGYQLGSETDDQAREKAAEEEFNGDWRAYKKALQTSGVELQRLRIPHTMGLLAVRSLCPKAGAEDSPLAINVPSYWTEAGPGLTLNTFLQLSLIRKPLDKYSESTGLQIVKAVDAGDFAKAKKVLHTAVPDSTLAAVKKTASEREANARKAYLAIYAKSSKSGRINNQGGRTGSWATDIKKNPTAEYRVLLDRLFPETMTAGSANKTETEVNF